MDDDAVRFLKIFTFLSLDEIAEIEKEFNAARHERLAQKSWLVKLLHLFTVKKTKEALKITEQLFAGNIKSLSAKN